jgi:hypothetical protein
VQTFHLATILSAIKQAVRRSRQIASKRSACMWMDAGSCESQMTSQTQEPRKQHKCGKRSKTKKIKAKKTYLVDSLDLASPLRTPGRWWRGDRTAILATSGGGAWRVRSEAALLGRRGHRGPSRSGTALRVHVLPEVGRKFLVLICEFADAFLRDPIVPSAEIVRMCSPSSPNICASAWGARRHDQCITLGTSSSSDGSYA